MRKIVSVLWLGWTAYSFAAITPPPTPGQNVWNLTARIGEQLDSEIDFGLSLVETIDSKVDALDATIDGIVSCCDQSGSIIANIATTLEAGASSLDHAISVVEVIQDFDLVRLESKIDASAGIIEQSLQDQFAPIESSLTTISSTMDGIESDVDAADSSVEILASLVEEIQTVELPEVVSKLDDVVSELDAASSLCDEITTVQLPRIESKIDDIASEVDNSVLQLFIDSSLEGIESTIDVIDNTVSVIEEVTSVTDSVMDYTESVLDVLLASSGGGASACAGTPITQASLPLTISTAGYYCLAQDAIGSIVINASNVTIDLNGHTLTGQISFSTVTREHCVVRNGRLIVSSAGSTALLVRGNDIVIEDILFYSPFGGISGTAALSIGFFVSPNSYPARQVTVRRCEFVGATNVGTLDAILMQNIVSHIVIEDCSFNGFHRHIVAAINSGGPSDDFIINRCKFVGSVDDAISLRSLVGSLTRVSNVQILDSIFTGCNSSFGNAAIYVDGTIYDLDGAADILVKGCILTGNARHGIYGWTVKKFKVVDCEIIGNGLIGVYLRQINYGYVGDSIINSNGAQGLYIQSYGWGVVERNTFEANGSNGLLVSGSVYYSIEHNDFINNGAVNLNLGGTEYANSVIANKAQTTNASSTAGNYSAPTAIPMIEYSRSVNTANVLSGGTAVTGWHNWSSIA